MTHRDIIERTIRLQATPRLPVSLLSAGAWTLLRGGLTLEQALTATPERVAAIIAATNEEVGCDIVWPGSGYHNLAVRGAGGVIKFRAKGTPDVMAPLFASAAEVDLRRAATVSDDPGARLLVAAARILARQIGAHTVVGTSSWAPFTLAGHAIGVENLMRALRKSPADAHRALAFGAELCWRYLEPFIDAGVTMISIADPTASGDLISREQFIEFVLPYLKNVGSKIKARGVLLTVHICGNTTNRLDQIPLAGADLMSVDYKVDLRDARRALGGKIAFAGNLNPVAVMQRETPAGVAAAVRDAVGKASPAAGYVVMPGCDIPPTVPVDNVKAMVAAAREYQL
ncbi:MAG: uroporphyrinogen decarboxylase family protein [Verrucomicrobiales bacterium]|jgi:uroporphyrinogen decarboxylase|nr:uroporphyrinogen decarboxylase family protein [Verrucomicrobiales bacterium]